MQFHTYHAIRHVCQGRSQRGPVMHHPSQAKPSYIMLLTITFPLRPTLNPAQALYGGPLPRLRDAAPIGYLPFSLLEYVCVLLSNLTIWLPLHT